MSLDRQHSFWGSLSPLGGLTGAGLLIMASARLAWAITIAGSLFWVFGLTSFAYAILQSSTGGKIFPARGGTLIFTCLASFFGVVYMVLFWLLSPFAAFEVFLPLMLVPLFCSGSSVIHKIIVPSDDAHFDIYDHVSEAVSQAAILAVLLIAFSIIREPLSYCSLSFPGTFQGMLMIMNFRSGSFFPIGIFASSAGAFLLLGYFICLYQYGKNFFFSGNSLKAVDSEQDQKFTDGDDEE